MTDIRWRLSVATPDGAARQIPASVPGCLHTDLLAAGLIGDFFSRENSLTARPLENLSPVYIGDFLWEGSDENAVLTLYGADVYARVSVNGSEIGSLDDMFHPWSFSLKGLLRQGANEIRVAFRPPVAETEGLPPRPGAFTVERLYTRRIQCTYGWDWVDRFVTMGLWKPVEIRRAAPDLPFPRRDGIYIRTESLNPFSAKLGLTLSYPSVSGRAWVGITVRSPEGKPVFEKRRRLLEPMIEEKIDVASPALWYPAGYGEQPLYTLSVLTFPDENEGEPIAAQSLSFGIRTAEILELRDEEGSPEAALARKLKSFEHLKEWDRNEGSSSFLLLVNGVRIFAMGANWVPPEPFPSAEDPEKTRRLVRLAREAGVNMLRVWGGGTFGSEAFFDACDREGILATQDFLMACGDYPEEDPAFLSKLRLEAREAALTLRNHPSLVWWSGDNENAVSGDENSPSYNGRSAALYAIGPVLKEEDPFRRFLPSSPYGGVPYASATRGTTHNTQFLSSFFAWVREGDFHGYREYFDRYLARFTAEQPAIGMPFVSSLLRFMTEEDVFGKDTAVSEFHTKNNPGLGEISLYGYVERLASGIFGPFRDGADRVRKMQLLQCEWIRLSLSLFRRNAWFSSGILYWMWNDCWPAANGWSMIDYYARPKPSWYAFREAASPAALSVTEEEGKARAVLSFFGVGEALNGRGTLSLYHISTGGETPLSSFSFSLPAGGTAEVVSVPAPPSDPDVLYLAEAETSRGALRAFSLPAGMNYADTTFGENPGSYEVLSEDEGSILILGTDTVPFVLLDRPDSILSENAFFLKKGERRLIRKNPAGPLFGFTFPPAP